MSEILKISARYSASEQPYTATNELSILIRECIAGSQGAQKKLYDIYSPAAYGTIKRYLYNNEELAQEILNDAFYKVLTKLDTFSFQGPFEGWIRRIVVNTATDHLRKTIKNEPHREVQPEDAYVPSESVSKIAHKELLKLVQELPDAQRTVFNLYVFENYSHKEIGTILNINDNNSRWHLNDARRRLKEKVTALMK